MKTIILENTKESIGADLFDKTKSNCKTKKGSCGCGCSSKNKPIKIITGGLKPFNFSGKIIDAKTKEPMPLVNIISNQIGKGTFTDNHGGFNFNTKSGNDIVEFSHVGYDTLRFPASKIPATVEMKESENVLDEVIVSSKDKVKNIKPAWWVAAGLLALYAYAKTKGTKQSTNNNINGGA